MSMHESIIYNAARNKTEKRERAAFETFIKFDSRLRTLTFYQARGSSRKVHLLSSKLDPRT